MESDRTHSEILKFVPHAAALFLFGIFFESALSAAALTLPQELFFEASYTLAFARASAVFLGSCILYLGLIVWLFSPMGRDAFAWSEVDSVGGLRWLTLLLGATLAWSYAGQPYNYYFDQSHVWDRWLAIVLLISTLRSPVLLPFFVMAILVARGQLDHALAGAFTIADELPLRVLGLIAGCAVWNGLLRLWGTREGGSSFGKTDDAFPSLRIETRAVVYAILCTISFEYLLAALGKFALGREPLDWIWFSHMENLFVSSHLNGWLSQLSQERVLAIADVMRSLHLPIAISTILIELGMVFLLFRQRATLLLLALVSSMHLGIVVTTGIIFWKWLAIDAGLLVWLWVRRSDPQVLGVYARGGFVASVLIVGLVAYSIGGNQFAWWNTTWTMLYEVEVRGADGRTYVVNPADFKPYTFFDVYKPDGRKLHTYVYGMTVNRKLREFFEAPDPETLERFATSAAKPGDPPFVERGKGKAAFADFMTRYFTNRNAHPGRNVPPFLIAAPALHNRYLRRENLYRDQAPVVAVQLRFKEVYYTGSELKEMRNEVVYSIPIPR